MLGFKCKAFHPGDMCGNFGDQRTTRPQRRRLWAKGRQASGDEIGVDERRAIRFLRQELACESCLPGAVRACNKNNFMFAFHTTVSSPRYCSSLIFAVLIMLAYLA